MKNDKTLTLSIVIPAYNEERYIAACLNAIARQTTAPDEVIVVDNNSTDSTASIAKKYHFVKLLIEKNQGVVFARNRGFDAAKSHLIARIDADTNLPSNWVATLKSMYHQAGQPNLFAVTAPSRFRNRLGVVCYGLHRLTYFWPSRLLLGHVTFVGSNMCISRQTWRRIKSQLCIRTDIHEDMDLAFHVARAGVPIAFTPKLQASVVARQMHLRLFSYPAMMLRMKLVKH